MSLVEITLSSGLLLIGRPADLPASVRRASDRLRIDREIARLASDRAALGQLRRGLADLLPAQPAAALAHDELLALVRATLAAGRLEAALLPFEVGPEPAPARFATPKSRVMHLVDANRTVIIAPTSHWPPELWERSPPMRAAAVIRGFADGQALSREIERQAARLWPDGVHERMPPAALRSRIAQQVEAGTLTAAVLTAPIHRRQAGLRDDAPPPVAGLGRDEKVAIAMRRSTEHLTGAVREIVEQMVSRESLAIMAGLFIAVALAQLTPISAAAVDAVVLGIALAFAGLAGIAAIGTLVDATVTAMGAQSDADLDAAARLYAQAFAALGAAALAALLRRFVKAKGGGGEKGNSRRSKPAPADTRRSPSEASRPVGRKGEPIDVRKGTNAETRINGREYGGHAIDQMQGRGVPPSAVENTIAVGRKSPDPIPGRTRHYDPVNNLTVVTESNGRVVTVITGKR